MAQLEISHITIMLASMIALIFVNMLSLGLETPVDENSVLQNWRQKLTTLQKSQYGSGIIFTILFFCSIFAGMQNFIGSLAIFGSILVLMSGRGDTRYAAKKFAAYHFLSLILCATTTITSSMLAKCVMYFAAFGILTASYPLNGWLSAFFSRAPRYLLSTWLVVFRTIAITFLLSTACDISINSLEKSSNIIISIFVYASLFFVPILFFAKTGLSMLVARITCWQSGYIWLFLQYLPQNKFSVIILLALTQGIFLSIISQSINSLCEQSGSDSAENLSGLFNKNYFSGVFIMSSMVFLSTISIFFLFKKGMPELPADMLYKSLASMILPVIFCIKIYKKMQSPSAAIKSSNISNAE